jgi:hypothetical protein
MVAPVKINYVTHGAMVNGAKKTKWSPNLVVALTMGWALYWTTIWPINRDFDGRVLQAILLYGVAAPLFFYALGWTVRLIVRWAMRDFLDSFES